jgi:hypothetical protein
MLYISVQKQLSSFRETRLPSLVPAHHCTAISDLWPCHMYESVSARGELYLRCERVLCITWIVIFLAIQGLFQHTAAHPICCGLAINFV